MARSTKNSAWNEVFAIILLLTGTLLFFALISYSPRDLPSWVPWSYLSPPNRPAQNFIGPFGAIFASIFYLLIGAASYFLAAVLLGFGAAKLFYPRLRVVARLPWIVLFLLSGACLFQLQTRYFFEWKKLNIQGPGGSIGYFFGRKLLLSAMGDVGSMILSRWNLSQRAHFDDRIAPNPSCPRNGRWHSQWRGSFSRMAIAPRNGPHRYQGSVGN